jgi:hypothetical protein
VLYPWAQASSLNGRVTFAAQGICPDGWRVPQDYDFGVLLDALEDDPAYRNNLVSAPGFGGDRGTSYLKSTHSARPSVARVDTSYATATNPVWAWRRADTLGKVALPHISLGRDKYGFKLLPAGYAQSGNHFYLGAYAVLWTLTESDGASAWSRQVRWNRKESYRAPMSKEVMASVRCVRGETAPGGVLPAPTLVTSNACLGNPLTVRVGNPSAFPGGPFTFEVNGVQQALSVPYLTLPAGTPVGSYAIKVKVGESEWSAEAEVKVNPLPAPATLAYQCNSDQTAVVAASLPATPGGAALASVDWGSGSFESGATTTRTLTGAEQTVSIARTMDANGCVGAADATITLYAKPTASIASAYTVSDAKTLTYTGAAAGGSGAGYTYAWATAASNTAPADPASYGGATSAALALQTAAGGSNYWKLRVRDSKSCVSDVATATFAIPAGVTYCAGCGYNGAQWVDAWVSSENGALVTFGGQGTSYGTDLDNGRGNSAKMAALAGIKACTNKGTGWYLPALNELEREMSTLNRCLTTRGSAMVSTEQSATHMYMLWADNTGAYATSACPTKNYHRALKGGGIAGDSYGTILNSCHWRP